MLHDAQRAAQLARHMRDNGVYVVAFSYPVVPKGQARIRTQMSAALTRDDLDRALEAFSAARDALA
jgi:glycine C-acetyltransferase